LKDVTGVIVAGVVSGGPADRAGIRRGDIITHIAGKAIEDGQSALRIISTTAPGTSVEMRMIRNGSATSKNAVVAQRPVPER